MQKRFLLAFAAALLAAGCQNSTVEKPSATSTTTPPAQTERPYLLEQVDDAAVAQIYADGFSALPLKEKTLIWHLYQAALAGRDIYYDQKHVNALEMRDVVENILQFGKGDRLRQGSGSQVDADTMKEIQRYTKLFWINTGPYNNLTARKFVLKCTPEAFARAVKAAAANGAKFKTNPGETIEAMLARLQPMFFDPTVDPIVTNKTPPAGKDILTASATNVYSGVSMADLKGFAETHGVNSRLVKRDGRLVEEVYKIDGKYGAQIAEIVRHLQAAIPYATEPMAKALQALIRFYQTGETTDRVPHDIAWVQDKGSPVDTINGFIEVYLDPRGVKGAWEALVFYVNQDKTQRIRTIGANAQWFEDHMPWDPKYRKASVTGIVANAIDVVIETGESGPITPVGINLPNDGQIRETYGSKSVSLSNVNESYDKSSPGSMRSEFSWSLEEAARAAKWGTLAGELNTDMHEVIGHASGKLSPALKGTPQQALKEHYSALEEGRADLVALYYVADPKLAELGVVPAADQRDIMTTEYEAYTRNALVQLRRMRDASQIAEDHMRNRQMIVRWLMANTKAIEERTRDNKTYYVMVDATAFRDGVGRLLAEVQRIKAEGDYAAAQKLMDTYGVRFDAKLRDEVVARVDSLNLPSYTGFVMPKLTPRFTDDGRMVDVLISYPKDLTTQMMEFAGRAQK